MGIEVRLPCRLGLYSRSSWGIGSWLWMVSRSGLTHLCWVSAVAATTEVTEYAVSITHVANALSIIVSAVIWRPWHIAGRSHVGRSCGLGRRGLMGFQWALFRAVLEAVTRFAGVSAAFCPPRKDRTLQVMVHLRHLQ